MEGTNSFEKGLHRSNSPQMQPEGSYVDAYNWIRNDSGRLTNEELEEILGALPTTHTYLGSCPVQDSFICFFKEGVDNSEIGIFNNGEYTTVFNDSLSNPAAPYKLNFNKEIDSVARINSKQEIVVYFVEEDNKPRRFNITLFQDTPNPYSSEIYDTIEDWNLQLDYKMPYANYTVQPNGTLPSGTYSFAFRYATSENNKTTFNIPSRFINIAPSVEYDGQGNPIYNDTTVGALPQTASNQKIVISLKNLDLNYPFIEPVVITYLGLTNVLSIKSLGLFENRDNLEIIFSTEDQYLQDVSETALLEIPLSISSAKCIEQKDNILVLSNITSKKFDVGFQEVANQIELYWEIDKKQIDTRRNITGVRRDNSINWPSGTLSVDNRFFGYISNINDNQTVDASSRDQNSQNSNVYQDPTILKGFQRGEVYSFSITPIYKDGSVGFAYHIPGNLWPNGKPTNGLASWTSEEDYTEIYQEAGLNDSIRHHQMPDYNETGYIGDEDYINILRVRAKNINFTSEQLQNIQGYIIGFQPRNNDTNTRIIDNGFSRPYLKNEQDDKYIGTLWTGNPLYVEKLGTGTGNDSRAANTWSPNWFNNRDYAMYHSPDTILNKDKIKAGYKIQRIGYGNNLILHAANATADKSSSATFNKPFFEQYLTKGFDPYYVKMTLPICTNREASNISQELYANFFFEFNEFVFNKGNAVFIDKAQPIPYIGAENSITIDNKITIKYSSEYIHLKTLDSHFFDNASNAESKYFLDFKYWISQIAGSTDEDKFGIFNPANYYVLKDDATQRISINLCRIIYDNAQQYGKLENGEYTPAVVVLNLNETEPLLEGDVYISKYFFYIYDKLYGNTDETVDGKSMMGIYVESKNNYSLRHTEDNKVPFYPNYKYFVNANEENIGMFNLDWYKVTTGYNKQYSAITNPKVNFPKPLLFKDISQYSNRSVYSSQSFESELVDQYRSFPPNNFHDIPRHRGVIKDTFVFNNNFFHHTEYGLWLSYFNPNTTQTTSQGEVVLGNAGIFRLPSKLVLDIKGGYMGTMDKSGTNTPFGRVFLDHKQGKIFLFSGDSPVEISDLGLFSFFRGFVNINDKYSMGYDWANKRLLVNNITQGKAISFYPKTQTWTSFHDFSPNAYFTINGSSYAWRNNENSFYNMDNTNGIRKNSYITFVENTQPDAFKRFDRIEMNTMSGGNQGINSPGFVEPNSYIFNDESFSTIHCWTDRQNSTELPFAYSHDFENNFLNNYDSSKVPTNYYRSSFHAELPLDAVVDPYVDIFDSNNLKIDADFRAHMKGKFLYTKLSYNQDKPLVLNYIKTFFKPSVA